MGDFGKILDEWESVRKAAHRPGVDPSGDSESFARALEKYPVVDKDRGRADQDEQDERLRPERLRVEATLDLHGFTLAEAIEETDRFIESSLTRGLRKVMVIHGKGHNGEGVLKREIRAHLERHPKTGALGYAKGPDGGRGALWVMLRNRGGATARGK